MKALLVVGKEVLRRKLSAVISISSPSSCICAPSVLIVHMFFGACVFKVGCRIHVISYGLHCGKEHMTFSGGAVCVASMHVVHQRSGRSHYISAPLTGCTGRELPGRASHCNDIVGLNVRSLNGQGKIAVRFTCSPPGVSNA